MYLIKRVGVDGKIRRYDISLRNHDDCQVKIPGDRLESVAREIGLKAMMLVRAKHAGEPAPVGLSPWIQNMPTSLARRLVKLGLLDRRRTQQFEPLTDHINLYRDVVAARRSNGWRHARAFANAVHRVCRKVEAQSFSDLTEERIVICLRQLTTSKGALLSTKTRREYIIALKDFCRWMVNSERAVSNPITNLRTPGAFENPLRERRPLTVEEFRRLAKYLGTFERYPHQVARWTARDRLVLYWTAVKTGLRLSELASLTLSSVDLTSVPSRITIKARNAKNKTSGVIPIPADLAEALSVHAAKLKPEDRLFKIPTRHLAILRAFYRDLEGAGIPRRSPTGEVVDFHALRSTAITWWLNDGLSLKQVQLLARLKTLALVERYSRNYRLDDFAFLERGPKLADQLPLPPASAGIDQQPVERRHPKHWMCSEGLIVWIAQPVPDPAQLTDRAINAFEELKRASHGQQLTPQALEVALRDAKFARWWEKKRGTFRDIDPRVCFIIAKAQKADGAA